LAKNALIRDCLMPHNFKSRKTIIRGHHQKSRNNCSFLMLCVVRCARRSHWKLNGEMMRRLITHHQDLLLDALKAA
jgi:hypothetical protein